MGAVEKLSSEEVVQHLEALPELPKIVYELNRVINDPMSSISEVESIMASDQGMTTKVLRLANSAYYSIPGGVSNLRRAIAYIGYDVVNQLVLSTSIVGALGTKNSDLFDQTRFWKHSLGVAMAAEATARFVGYNTPSDLFTCGLVHDMGKIATHIVAPDEFAEILEFAKTREVSVEEAEREVGGIRHTLVGRELAEKWRLPMIIQASVAYHHEKDPEVRGALSQELNRVVDIVLLSNLIVHGLKFGHSGHTKIAGVPKEVIHRLHLDQSQLKDLILKTKEALESADNFLSIIGS